MSSDDIAIRVENLSKCYQVYNSPHDRLKQAILPRLHKLLAKEPTKYFREFWALRNFSFQVARGETVGIMGRNGSGKSTLLQLICGTLEPTAGSVDTRGRVAALLELGAGFNPEFTGRENVFLNGTVLGLEQQEIEDRFDEIAAFADIGDFIEQPVKYYSSGMYARLTFAVAINVDPRILVVDEALAVGDEPFQRKCFAKIEQIKRGGGTILFVSHASSTIVALCDRAILLHEGKQLFSGRPKTAVGWYQKLMNAPENSAQIAFQISQLFQDDGQSDETVAAQDPKPVGIGGQDGPDAEHGRKIDAPPVDESGFDPNLVSQSMVAYQPNGARISNPRIENLNGEVVNLLANGQRYRVCYDVEFDRDCENVRFRCMLKTTTGVELGGGTYPVMYRRGLYMAAGQINRLEFAFNCNLNPGVYFFNCGLSENANSLHRIIDALTFRVPAVEGSYSFGTIDFNIESTLHSDAD